MSQFSKPLLSAALLVMVAGIGLALAQPGSLGGRGDSAAADTSTTTATSTSRDRAATSTSTSPTTRVTTTTVGPGSGLGTSGAARGSDTADGLATTGGGESLLSAGLVLGVAGLATRRRPTED